MMSPEQMLNMDPAILAGMINGELRNQFSSLEDLCLFYDIDNSALINRLNEGNYTYIDEVNQVRGLE